MSNKKVAINAARIEEIQLKIERLMEKQEMLKQSAQTIDELRRGALLAALDRTGGNRTYAAIQLGISLRTIRNWINKYEVK